MSSEAPSRSPDSAQASVDLPWAARLESAAAAALPAREQLASDGWLLRADDRGVVRRANSVLPLQAGERPLQEKVAEVVDWYRQQGRRPRFQLSPVSQPAGLAEVLERAGWHLVTPVRIMTAEVDALRDRCLERLGPDAGAGLEWLKAPDDGWLAAYASGMPESEVPARSRLAIAAPAPKAYLGVGGQACALVVQDHELAGLFDVTTVPAARRQGLASRLLAAAADWAGAQGVRTLYLQVAKGNVAAERLYQGFGFSTVYAYCYAEGPA